MPGTTGLGIRFPLSTEPPAGHSQMQTLAGDVDLLLRPPRARYYFTGATASRAPGAYQVVGTLGSVFQLNGITVVSSTRITVPVAGIYAMTARVQFAGATSGFGLRRGVMIRTNAAGDPAAGSNISASIYPTIQANLPQDCQTTALYALAAGAYVEFFSFHDASASINMNGGSHATSGIDIQYVGTNV